MITRTNSTQQRQNFGMALNKKIAHPEKLSAKAKTALDISEKALKKGWFVDLNIDQTPKGKLKYSITDKPVGITYKLAPKGILNNIIWTIIPAHKKILFATNGTMKANTQRAKEILQCLEKN